MRRAHAAPNRFDEPLCETKSASAGCHVRLLHIMLWLPVPHPIALVCTCFLISTLVLQDVFGTTEVMSQRLGSSRQLIAPISHSRGRKGCEPCVVIILRLAAGPSLPSGSASSRAADSRGASKRVLARRPHCRRWSSRRSRRCGRRRRRERCKVIKGKIINSTDTTKANIFMQHQS